MIILPVIVYNVLDEVIFDWYMRSYFFKEKDFERQWYIVDAKDLVLGRLASIIALRLKGKRKPYYTDSADCGDKIIVVNCDKICLTGKKMTDKKYYRHTSYPGAIKTSTPENILSGPNPTSLLRNAVKRMLSSGPLRNKIMKNLYLYVTPEHMHASQKPIPLDIASLNRKNSRL
ncbi:MAG: ribosomal protein L13 [Candidatus Xenolissoclinum pacificiensis L6]|uniref:Large ribosomal subunit protein uL13 n=1 Tax=Candidatus Xenolissoclinum pacificiensis L6 TaxID=1401685 RepID=W2V062_9RICK|nr:MAG: ribosomal protein L13 [Candidatus Xenolissoclinum pacificiensis L6]